MIITFSSLPSNTTGCQIKIRNHFIDLPQELMVSGERNTQEPIALAHSLSSWHAQEYEGGSVSVDTKQRNWVHQTYLAYMKMLGATLRIVL